MNNVKNVFILTLVLAMCVFGKEASLSKDMLRIDEFLQGYYLHPQPEAVPEMLLLLDKVAKTFKNREMDGMEAPIIGFFSEIFRANSDKLDEWEKVIKGLSSKSLKVFLDGALCYADTEKSKEIFKKHAKWSFILKQRYGGGYVVPILKWDWLSPSSLDMCWGAFMASGNKEYVKKVMECALQVPEKNRIDLTVGAARWSMVANADRHPLVAEVMNNFLKDAKDASFQYFTEAMPGELRKKLLTDENRARIEKLNVPLPEAEGKAAYSPAAPMPVERKPLPAKGPKVNYSEDPHFQKLYAEAKMHHKTSHEGNGRIVKGKLVVEGQENSVKGVATKALFAFDGRFVAPLYAGRTLRFVKHGYEPLDIDLPEQLKGIPGPDLDLGEQVLHRLPEDKTVTVQFELELPEGVQQANVELWTGDLPSTWNDDGYFDGARIQEFASNMHFPTGKCFFSGLTPMPYELRINAPGCMFCKKAFDASKEKDLGKIVLKRIRTATFQMAKYQSLETWKEVKIPIDGKTKLVFADKPDQFGQYDGFELTYHDETHLEAFFIYWPNFFDDYGKMSKEKYLELKGKNTLPTPRTVKGKTTLEVGHLYRFRCNSRKADLLLFFSEMEM